jgi:hypothetical protein
VEENNKTAVVQKLEIDLLVLFYNFSDQYGVVDVAQAALWAREKLGVSIPQTPFILTQKHIDFLIDKGVLPDLRPNLQAAKEGKLLRTLPGPKT